MAWFIFFVKRNYTLFVIIMFFLIGIVSYSINGYNIRILQWGNSQTLGIGAFLAYYKHSLGSKPLSLMINRNSKYLFWFFFLGYLLFQLFGASVFGKIGVGIFIEQLLFTSMLFVLILSTVQGWQGLMGALANNKQLQYLGRISYGIYLYHKPVPFALSGIIHFEMHPILLILVYLFTTIVIASVSYMFLEQPF